ncbi:MAG: carboxypeptidase-like regulatory domain-containing protein [Gemmatimonadota bacterium]
MAVSVLVSTAAPGSAQSVRGTVVEEGTGAPIAGVTVALVDSAGTPVFSAVSDAAGRFYIPAAGGTYRLEASHIAYATVRLDTVRIAAQERLELTIRMAAEAIALSPVEVTARRIDPRHLATLEGFYQRWRELPSVGPRRAVRRGEPEMRSALGLEDIVTWFGEPELPGSALFWNGQEVLSPGLAAMLLEVPIEFLEGVEFYRREIDAPLEYHTGRSCAASHRCPVLALWGRLPDGVSVEDAVAGGGKMVAEPAPGLPPTPRLELRFRARSVTAAEAGVVRGALLGPAGAQLAAAVIELVGPNGERLGITRADPDGAFTLTAPAPGRYHLRALHEMHGAATSDAFELADGQAADVLLTMGGG